MTADVREECAEMCARMVRRLVDKCVGELLAHWQDASLVGDGLMYSFDADTLRRRQSAMRLLREMAGLVGVAIDNGVDIEWRKADEACDRVVKGLFGTSALRRAKAEAARGERTAWAASVRRNEEAREAFKGRVEGGLDLSGRVWRTAARLKDEMEVALTIGIAEGKSAERLARDVRQYLNDPDLAFRRFRYKVAQGRWCRKWKRLVRDEQGRARWKDWDRDEYVPKGAGRNSRGVYKSARKNAMRLARTETNLAYRRADHLRWQGMAFVLGQEVKLSRSHPEEDICDAT